MFWVVLIGFLLFWFVKPEYWTMLGNHMCTASRHTKVMKRKSKKAIAKGYKAMQEKRSNKAVEEKA